MSAAGPVWRVSRGAVRRRRMQTIVIGLVVLLSTTTSVVALGLLAASSGPFDQLYDRVRGAHLVAAYDPAKVSSAQLAQVGERSGVEAAAGPFSQSILDLTFADGAAPSMLAVVGRSGPGGPVDRLNLWRGRWATGPGEIVFNQNPTLPYAGSGNVSWGEYAVGDRVTFAGGTTLTIVGFAFSVSESADAWVTPGQVRRLHPTSLQMLYRFDRAGTPAQIGADRATVSAALPSSALLSTHSYLALRSDITGELSTLVPFLAVFGSLALIVAVLIVANVISGAVVAGFRHIGMLKALGFTPTQVLVVYLAMVSIPAIAGSLLGTILGDLLARQLVTRTFENLGTGSIGVARWVDAAALLGMPVVVALSALLPALAARSLSAAEAISAGSTQRTGRGLRIQRWLGGTRLPRPVSLGLGLPFARPGRSGLTLAAVLVGVTSVTVAAGLAISVTDYETLSQRAGAVQVEANTGVEPGNSLGDAADERLLRSQPGVTHVTASANLPVHLAGSSDNTGVTFWRGDPGSLGFTVLAGHLPIGPGEVGVSERFLRRTGYKVGDTLTLEVKGRQARVRIAGQLLFNSDERMYSGWATLALLAPGTPADAYQVQLRPGTDPEAYVDQVQAADPGLQLDLADDSDSFIATILVTVSLLTLMLASVAALGVFNTVVLNARERRRDLGMLKSIGMTPGQVTVMMVTSMAALGAVGGLIGIPIGIGVHRLVLPAMAHAAQVAFTDAMINIYRPALLAALALAGIAIAALGAYLPARSAGRLTIAEVLHNE